MGQVANWRLPSPLTWTSATDSLAAAIQELARPSSRLRSRPRSASRAPSSFQSEPFQRPTDLVALGVRDLTAEPDTPLSPRISSLSLTTPQRPHYA